MPPAGAAAGARACAPGADTPGRAISLEVDATDLDRGIFRVREILPVERAGAFVLAYPKWIPGYHAPAGPIESLAGLRVFAAGRELEWRRDPRDVYEFHVGVPEGVTRLELDFQHLSAVTAEQGRVVTSPAILAMQWHPVVLIPKGAPVEALAISASLELPHGWSLATSLDAECRTATNVRFRQVSVATLVDSPVYAGSHLARFELDPASGSPVRLNVLADRPDQIDLAPELLRACQSLVRQAGLLLGVRPFGRYEFLVTLGERIGGYGLEHRQSGEISVAGNYFADWRRFPAADKALLAHEYVHTWNGKLRRSAGLSSSDFGAPLTDTMLWVYEGLTEYWAQVLTARSGLRTREEALEALASIAATSANRPGRAWRSLADTTLDPQIRRAAVSWPSWQRADDYYLEGPLFWLDVDARIRALSEDRRSLDDFARAFFADAGARANARPYTHEDIVRALNDVQPYDWAAHLDARLHGREAPLAGLELGGWRLVHRTVPTDFDARAYALRGGPDLSHSVGFTVGAGGVLTDVTWGSAAFDAGLTVGARLVAVSGRSYEPEELERAIARAERTRLPIQAIVANGSHHRAVELAYFGGLRYPHLERIPGAPDRLGAILSPRDR